MALNCSLGRTKEGNTSKISFFITSSISQSCYPADVESFVFLLVSGRGGQTAKVTEQTHGSAHVWSEVCAPSRSHWSGPDHSYSPSSSIWVTAPFVAFFKFSFWNMAIYPTREFTDFLLNSSVQDVPGLCSPCSRGCLRVPACPWQPTLEQSWQQGRQSLQGLEWHYRACRIFVFKPLPSWKQASSLQFSTVSYSEACVPQILNTGWYHTSKQRRKRLWWQN